MEKKLKIRFLPLIHKTNKFINHVLITINITKGRENYTMGVILHNPSFRYAIKSIPMPLLIFRISSDDIFMTPIAIACSFPSAITATIESFGKSSVIFAPGDVRPGHMIFEPFKTNFIAPLST